MVPFFGFGTETAQVDLFGEEAAWDTEASAWSTSAYKLYAEGTDIKLARLSVNS